MDFTLINLAFYLSQFVAMGGYSLNPTIPINKKAFSYLVVVGTVVLISILIILTPPDVGDVIFAPLYLEIVYILFTSISVLVFLRNFSIPQAVTMAYLVTFFMNFFWQVPVYVHGILTRGVETAVMFHLIIAYSGVFIFKNVKPIKMKYFNIVLLAWLISVGTILMYPNPNDYMWRPYMSIGALSFVVVRIVSFFGLILMLSEGKPKH